MTEIFLPRRIYGGRYAMSEVTVSCSEGRVVRFDKERQVLMHEGPERDEREWKQGRIEISIRKTKLREGVERAGVAAVVVLLAMGGWWVGWEVVWAWVRWVVGLLL